MAGRQSSRSLHDLSYYMHDGGHGMVPSDWGIYVEFLKAQFHPEQ